MKPTGVAFHHPVAFWAGCALIVAGVLAHGPMFLMGEHTHWRMVGMPMTPEMWVGMAIIPIGLALSAYGLLPRAPSAGTASAPLHFHVADGAPLNREHLKLVLVLVVTLAIDVMKPATLGFVMPGMSAEYRITTSRASLLALVALVGTTVGSIAWGRLADVFGRRAAILLSALMFIGTAICGAMPRFEWNLAMCFLMGASAGGLLPITFTLMAETVPARHRGWLLVALGGVGTTGGYLLAAGAAALLEPLMSWRVLWLLGLPTGAVIIFLNRFIPESPRFLSGLGRHDAARAVLARFAGRRDAIELDDAAHPGAPVIDDSHPVIGMRELVRGRHAAITWALLVAGLAWGLANFGFLLWLPVNLTALGALRAAGHRARRVDLPPLEQLPLARPVSRRDIRGTARVRRTGAFRRALDVRNHGRHRRTARRHQRRDRDADPVRGRDLSAEAAGYRFGRGRGQLEGRRHPRRRRRRARVLRPLRAVGGRDRAADGGRRGDAVAQWRRDPRHRARGHPGDDDGADAMTKKGGNKTKATGADVAAFLDAVEGEERRADCAALVAMMSRVTGEPPLLWGPSIVGFGRYHYRYASGHEGDAPLAGFSPRAKEFSIYLNCDDAPRAALLAKLGKHRMAKSCLYVKRLADVDAAVLEALVRHAAEDVRQRYA